MLFWYLCSEATVGKDSNTEKDATDQVAPSTSVAEVDNTEELVQSRPQSVQDNMDAVDTNNEPRKYALDFCYLIIFFLTVLKTF